MSEGLEDVSVAETTPVESPAVPVEPVTVFPPSSPVSEGSDNGGSDPSPAEAPSGHISQDESPLIGNITIQDSQRELRQDAAEANGNTISNPSNNNSNSVAVTQRDSAKQEEKEGEKQAILDAIQAKHKEWLDRDHEFGGMKLSGHDLERMMNFISNPDMQTKLRERLGKSGQPKDKIDKGMKELNEFIDLKKKEKEGSLTPEEMHRLKMIQQSEEFRVVAEETQKLHEASRTQELNAEDAARRVATTESSYSAGSADFSNRPESAVAPTAKVVFFDSHSVSPIKTSTDPQAQFNASANGRVIDSSIPRQNHMALALSTAEPSSGLGI